MGDRSKPVHVETEQSRHPQGAEQGQEKIFADGTVALRAGKNACVEGDGDVEDDISPELVAPLAAGGSDGLLTLSAGARQSPSSPLPAHVENRHSGVSPYFLYARAISPNFAGRDFGESARLASFSPPVHLASRVSPINCVARPGSLPGLHSLPSLPVAQIPGLSASQPAYPYRVSPSLPAQRPPSVPSHARQSPFLPGAGEWPSETPPFSSGNASLKRGAPSPYGEVSAKRFAYAPSPHYFHPLHGQLHGTAMQDYNQPGQMQDFIFRATPPMMNDRNSALGYSVPVLGATSPPVPLAPSPLVPPEYNQVYPTQPVPRSSVPSGSQSRQSTQPLEEANAGTPFRRSPIPAQGAVSPVDGATLREPLRPTARMMHGVPIPPPPIQGGSAKQGSKNPTGKEWKPCKCKRSQCLKMYCDCFAAGVQCTPECTCFSCHNKEGFEKEQKAAREHILSRNANAFKPKIQSEQNADEPKHVRGCKCKRSGCLKRYCECFQAGVYCTEKCRCSCCQNTRECHGQFGAECRRESPHAARSASPQPGASELSGQLVPPPEFHRSPSSGSNAPSGERRRIGGKGAFVPIK